MFIDELTIFMKSGRGGDGVVRWRHEKGKEYSGASGGNGGRGGDIYAEAVRDIGILSSYRHVKEFTSERGGDGMKNSMHGRDGKDLTLKFPIGTILKNVHTGEKFQLLNEGERVLLLKGGRGGLGNEHFKSSRNVTPKESTPGKVGEEANFEIELNIVADAGLIGLPNAGKSSLLNSLTNADAKVGSYEFTTLDPNLGDFYGFILADIPGLIEGASEGRGLGHKFLRHIKRTKILIHLVSLENDALLKVYDTVREELGEYDKELLEKEEVVVLTKTDAVTPIQVKKAMEKMKKRNKKVFAVSIINDEELKKLRDGLVKILRKAK